MRQRKTECAAFSAVDAAVECIAAAGGIGVAAKTNNVVITDAAVLLRGVCQ